jgi:hypothetical protein
MENRGEQLTHEELDQMWNDEPDNKLQQYQVIADDHLQRTRFLMVEVTRVLRKVRGSITWRQLTVEVSGVGIPITNPDSLCKQIMALPDSTYKTTKLHPKLDKGKKKIRWKWAIGFWIFWNSAKKFALTVRVLLCHMDEKWFYAIVIRKNNKSIPALGVEPVQHNIQHKSHIYKEMMIASTAFLPHDNDMTKGGAAFKLNLVRVGRKQPAKKDSYKRVYKPDGSFHYPPLPGNILRKKGELYFAPMEIKATSEGTTKEPKFLLLKYNQETEIPKLDELAAELSVKHNCRIAIRYQVDGAGPHTDTKLMASLRKDFDDRGWLFTFQPPNSPLTNVKDACIFPAMSKSVTWEQAATNGSLVLEGEQLWECVQRVWQKLEHDVIGRSYLGHHQIVNAIVRDKGGDQFVRDKKGMHFGVRKLSVPYYDGDATVPAGVHVVEMPDTVATDELDRNGWKYPVPDVSNKRVGKYLSRAELTLLEEHLPCDTREWERIAAHNLTVFEAEGDFVDAVLDDNVDEDSVTVDDGPPNYAFFVDAVMDENDNMAETSVTVDDDRAFFLL